MEAVIAVILIAGICFLVGVPPVYIILGFICLVLLALAAMALMFFYCFYGFVRSEKHFGTFIRFEQKEHFKYAVYFTDGKEYGCIFPCESFFRKKLYRDGKKYRLMVNKKRNTVYDGFASATCVIGFTFSLLMVAAGVLAVHGILMM